MATVGNSVKATSKVGDRYARPIQMVSFKEKTPEWYRSNVDYLISRANFNFGTETGNRKDIRTLYQVYNNQFPLDWFKHITNPLSASKKEHKNFPAKIRPVTILRTNIDLLLGEYPRRPFVYNVANLGESGYNRFMAKMQEQAQATMTQHFTQAYLQELQAGGQQLTPEQLQQLQQNPPVPEQVKQEFQSSYKDEKAIKGQKYLRKMIRAKDVRRKIHKMFKHWLIAGEAISYKSIENDQLVYRDISPLCSDYDKTHSSDFIEDGEWFVYRDYYTLSDVVDMFYQSLKEQHLKELEDKYQYENPRAFFEFLTKSSGSMEKGKIPVFHTVWKGRKKIGFLSYLDMETFQYVEDTVDENYVVDRDRGEQVEWVWVNEVYQGWRIMDDIYCDLEAFPVQRNEMNNHSVCKLPYNGRRYSDLHSDNLSVLEIGIPFQILYIIITYILEKTIAKSKGKIVMLDKRSIPTDGDWDEEKFFYYGEALGYALIDRSNPGVDKTWNQYQVLDMGLFDQIEQLIKMQDWAKQQWDDVIGITRQRKGQTYSSDGQGVNERAVFQSTVITDMIFLGFEEFVQRELQGIMDYAKFTTAKGDYSLYNDDDYGTTLMDIMPEDFPDEELGVFVTDSSEEMRKLNEMKQYAQAMMQNGSKPSTVLEVIDSINVAELKQKLRYLESIEAEMEQQQASNEQEAEAAADDRAMRMKAYEALLDRQFMHEEYSEKQDLEYIKGTFNTFTFQDGDANANGVPDAAEVQKVLQGQQKISIDHEKSKGDRQLKADKLQMDREKMEHDMKMDIEDNKIKREKLKIDRKKASQKPKAPKK